MILIGKQSGLPTVYGAVIGCGILTILIAPVFSSLLRFFIPAVIGSVIVAIGLSLMPTAAMWLERGNPQSADFGSMMNLGLGLGTILVILALYVWGNTFISNLSALLGMVIGTLFPQLYSGLAHFDEVGRSGWIAVTRPLIRHAQIRDRPDSGDGNGMLAVMTETTGNCLAIGRMVNRPVSPRILADAFRRRRTGHHDGRLLQQFSLQRLQPKHGADRSVWSEEPLRVVRCGHHHVLHGTFSPSSARSSPVCRSRCSAAWAWLFLE